MSTVDYYNSTISVNREDGIKLRDSARLTMIGCTVSENGHDGIELEDSAHATILRNKIINNAGYGISLEQRPCSGTDEVFTGQVSGKGNIIPVPGEQGANCGNPVCPMPELEFLVTEEGGQYP